MTNLFFEKPVLNSPYSYPERHWELDDEGQPTQQIIEKRRPAEFITPTPKPRKRKQSAQQPALILGDTKGLSTAQQQYASTAEMITALRGEVDRWRAIPNPGDWHVTPETARPSWGLLTSLKRLDRIDGGKPRASPDALRGLLYNWSLELAPGHSRPYSASLQPSQATSDQCTPKPILISLLHRGEKVMAHRGTCSGVSRIVRRYNEAELF